MTLPSGTVTFLFTDMEGSTKLARDAHLRCAPPPSGTLRRGCSPALSGGA